RRRSGAGRALHAAKIRLQLSAPRHLILPGTVRCHARAGGPDRLLRQALSQIRASARNLSQLLPARIYLVSHGVAIVAARETVPKVVAGRRIEDTRTKFRLGGTADSGCSSSASKR